MELDRILYPVTTLGPGRRIALWTVGCSKACPRCANPELWARRPDKDVPVARIVEYCRQIMSQHSVDGFTLTGGDPLEQPGELLPLAQALGALGGDVLLYTGYTLAEAEALLGGAYMAQLREAVAVIIDGPYIDALNDGVCALRGSSNQGVHIYNQGLRPIYEACLAEKRQVQNFYAGEKLISVGIHNRPDTV